MGIKFTDSSGGAKKRNFDQYEIKFGDNHVRFFGDLLPRYIYWVDGLNNKKVPMECLGFDREKEAFTNEEKDWVKEFLPDIKCQKAYSVHCIDPADGKVKVFNLKSKLMDQIRVAAEDLGDPCDVDSGWDVFFKKEKTGPQTINVDYILQTLKCSKSVRPLTPEELTVISESPTIDELLPRPTPDAQKDLLERISSQGAGADENKDEETLEDEFDVA